MAGRKFQASIQAGKLVLEAGTVPSCREASVSFETRWTGKGYIEGGRFYEQVEAGPETADLIFLSVGEDTNRWIQEMKKAQESLKRACLIPGWVQNPFGRKRFPGFVDQAYLDSLKAEASPEAFKAEYLCSPYNAQDIRVNNALYGTVTGRMSCKIPNESNRPKRLSEELAKKVDEMGVMKAQAVGLDYAKLEASLMSTLAKMKDRPPVDPYSIHAERMVNGWEFKGGYPKLTIGDRRQIIQAFNRTFLSTGDREFARSLSRKEYRRIMFAKARQIVKQVFFTEAYGGRSKIGGISSPNAQRVAPDFFQERRF